MTCDVAETAEAGMVPEESSGQGVQASPHETPVAAVSAPPYFRCEPLGCGLSVESCVKRYLRIITPSQGYGRTNMDMLHAGGCRGCSVGAAHCNGSRPNTWGDGKPVRRASSPEGLGVNEHKDAGSSRCFVRRSYSVATVPPNIPTHGGPSQAQCECGKWYEKRGTAKRCSACRGEAAREKSAERRSWSPTPEARERNNARQRDRYASIMSDPALAAKRREQVRKAVARRRARQKQSVTNPLIGVGALGTPGQRSES